MKTPDTKTEIEIMAKIFMPLVEKHGLDKGGKIMAEVGKVLAAMQSWPEEIREDCMSELIKIIELAKTAAAQPNDKSSGTRVQMM